MASGIFETFRSTVEGVAWPPLATGTGALLEAYVARLERSQWLGPDAIEAAQRRQLELLARHSVKYSRGFAARLTAAGLEPADLAAPGGLQRLPPLTRRELQRGGEIFCDEVPADHLPVGANRTSGSTGEPVEVRRTALNQLGWMAMTVRDHRWHGRDARMRLAGMSAHNREVTTRSDWGGPIALAHETGPAMVFPATADVAAMHATLLAFDPEIVVIYPTMLAALIDEIERTGRRLPHVRHLRCMSETVSDDLRARAAVVFGLELEEAYSSEEFGFLALQCPDAGGLHVMAETHIVEIVDDAGNPCAAGETGQLLITDLHNFATPLVRYAIGDHAVAGGPCPCGRGLPRIERVAGRTRNLVRRPDGTRHWPVVGLAKYRDIAPVTQFQLVQHDLARIEMRLVVERALTAAEEAALAAQVQASLGHPFAVGFSYFADAMPDAPSGKREDFVSLIADD